jgi:DNA-binding CsgD family transcriptional regulator
LGRHLERHLELIYCTVDQPAHWKNALGQIAQDIGAQSGMVSIDYLSAQRLLLQVSLGSMVTERAETERPAAWTYLREREGLAIKLAFERRGTPGYFPMATLSYLDSLAPHVQRAAELANQLSGLLVSNHLLSTDSDTGGLMLVDANLHIVAATPRAKRWLEHELKPLRDNFGRLDCSDAAVAERLRRQIESVRGTGEGKSPMPVRAIELMTRLGQVRISASPYQDGHRQRACLSRNSLVLLRVTPVVAPPATRVAEQARRWGFTASELAVLTLLVEGRDAAEIATTRNRSIETVRSQIKAILKKAGCHRIPELLVAARATDSPHPLANR